MASLHLVLVHLTPDTKYMALLHLVSLKGDGNGEEDAGSKAEVATALCDVVN